MRHPRRLGDALRLQTEAPRPAARHRERPPTGRPSPSGGEGETIIGRELLGARRKQRSKSGRSPAVPSRPGFNSRRGRRRSVMLLGVLLSIVASIRRRHVRRFFLAPAHSPHFLSPSSHARESFLSLPLTLHTSSPPPSHACALTPYSHSHDPLVARSVTDDEFTVMDVEEEQPEDEAPQPPRKRGRFENERSDSMSQGGGASQQHHEGEEPMTKAQKQRQRQRKQGSHRKPPVKFRR